MTPQGDLRQSVGGPYNAYIRLPKVLKAAQTVRETLGPGMHSWRLWRLGASWLTGRVRQACNRRTEKWAKVVKVPWRGGWKVRRCRFASCHQARHEGELGRRQVGGSGARLAAEAHLPGARVPHSARRGE
jgi:hypothetical protein